MFVEMTGSVNSSYFIVPIANQRYEVLIATDRTTHQLTDSFYTWHLKTDFDLTFALPCELPKNTKEVRPDT